MSSTSDAQTPAMKRRTFAFALAAALLCALFASAFANAQTAIAAPSFVPGSSSKAYRVVPTSANERVAYQRAVAACMDYEHQGNAVIVDVSDLGLTQNQALHVGYMIHCNGELFWINLFGTDEEDRNRFTTTTFTLPVMYDDATITSMRAELDAAVNEAFKRVSNDMDAVTKIHTLHDYLIDHMDYREAHKTAYDGLIKGGGDCFGFTRTMDLLLQRAGFQTDTVFNNPGSHSWNQVKVAGKWYNIDVTWDNGFTGRYAWKKTRCHSYLLQPDTVFAKDTHKGWWSNHKCTSKKYVMLRYPTTPDGFHKFCNDYKLYTKGFKSGGFVYKASGKNTVKIAGVSGSKLGAKKLTIPATVTYKKKTYKVNGIAEGAFASSKARTLVVKTSSLSKARVKGCLEGSQVAKIKYTGAAKKKAGKYKKYFGL